MDKKKNTGGPAFPFTHLKNSPHGQTAGWKGMDLRDYLAGQALVGLVNDTVQDCKRIAEDAYNIADAMIEERPHDNWFIKGVDDECNKA